MSPEQVRAGRAERACGGDFPGQVPHECRVNRLGILALWFSLGGDALIYRIHLPGAPGSGQVSCGGCRLSLIVGSSDILACRILPLLLRFCEVGLDWDLVLGSTGWQRQKGNVP